MDPVTLSEPQSLLKLREKYENSINIKLLYMRSICRYYGYDDLIYSTNKIPFCIFCMSYEDILHFYKSEFNI